MPNYDASGGIGDGGDDGFGNDFGGEGDDWFGDDWYEDDEEQISAEEEISDKQFQDAIDSFEYDDIKDVTEEEFKAAQDQFNSLDENDYLKGEMDKAEEQFRQLELEYEQNERRDRYIAELTGTADIQEGDGGGSFVDTDNSTTEIVSAKGSPTAIGKAQSTFNKGKRQEITTGIKDTSKVTEYSLGQSKRTGINVGITSGLGF